MFKKSTSRSIHSFVLFTLASSATMAVEPLLSSSTANRTTDRTIVVESSWWRPSTQSYSIGYEAAATNSTGILGQNVISGGTWFGDRFGMEFFLGYTKSANGATQSVAETTNILANPNTKSTVTTNSGSNTGTNLTFATNLKYRFVQTDWFQFYGGLMLAFFAPTSAEYATGSKTETFANASDTANKTVSETALGTIKSETTSQIGLGPRLGTEFYIKWFPHLAVGFSTGIFTTLNGKTTTTTDTATRSYTVTNGVEQTPTSSSTAHTVATNDLGFRGTTFGLGGTTFAFTGTFSLRYVW